MATAAPALLREEDIGYAGWRVALAAAGCIFVSFASLLVYTFGVFLKPIAAEFHWSREGVSAAFGIAALTVAACSPPLGLLLDRMPARRIILPCIAVFGIAFASLAFLTPHLWHLYLVFFVIGVVGNGTAHLSYTRALSTWFQERRGTAFSVLLAGGAFGAMVLPLTAQALINGVGWRNSFLILGAMVLLVGLPLGNQVREAKTRAAVTAQPREMTGASTAEGLRSRIFWIIVAFLFLCSISQNGAIAHISALLTDRGIAPASAALAASALGGATLLGRLVTGWLIDRLFAPRIGFLLLAIAAVGTLVLAHAHTIAAGVFGAVCIGLGMGGEADITPYLLSRYFGLRSFSTLYGFTWTAYAIAGAIGPVLMGKAFDMTGSYTTLLSFMALATLGGGALMLFLPRYRLAA